MRAALHPIKAPVSPFDAITFNESAIDDETLVVTCADKRERETSVPHCLVAFAANPPCAACCDRG